jgi:hypothetical protein
LVPSAGERVLGIEEQHEQAHLIRWLEPQNMEVAPELKRLLQERDDLPFEVLIFTNEVWPKTDP